MNPKVDQYLGNTSQWQAEQRKLREIALARQLTEELKWGCPCYTFDGANIVLIHAFKEYCAYLFFKGALLSDPRGILVQQTKNVQSARQIRFASLQEIVGMEATLQAYLEEAIEVERAGLKVEFKKTGEFTMPSEFQDRLDADPGLRTAFDALTPGRQRAYLLHFSTPKRAKTREARIEKAVPQILDGLGLND